MYHTRFPIAYKNLLFSMFYGELIHLIFKGININYYNLLITNIGCSIIKQELLTFSDTSKKRSPCIPVILYSSSLYSIVNSN